MKKIDTLLLLDGGKNERFWPLINKDKFKFNGVPLINIILDQYQAVAKKIVIVCSKNNLQITQELCQKYQPQIVLQQGNGQGAAVLSAKQYLNSQTLIVNASDLYQKDLINKIINADKDADCVIASVYQPDYFPGGYLKINNNLVTAVIEKPGKDKMPSPYYKLFIDYFNDITKFILVLENSNTNKDDLYEIALTNFIKSGSNLKYVVYDGDWSTLKYPWHVLAMMNNCLSGIKNHRGSNCRIAKNSIIEGEVFVGDNVVIYENSKIVGPAYIGNNVIIGSNALVIGSMVGDKSVVCGYSEVTRSYLAEDVWLHRNYAGDSIIGNNVLIGAGAVTANMRLDKKNVKSMVSGKLLDTNLAKFGCVIGDNCVVGVNCSI